MKLVTTGYVVSLAAVLVTACAEPSTVVIQPLRIINWSPGSGAVCVDPAAQVFVTFSDDLVTTSFGGGAIALRDSDGPVDTTLSYDKPTFTAHLAPVAALDFGRLYTVVVADTVAGTNDGPLPVELSSSFQTVGRTGCTPAPECQRPSDCPGTQLCSNIGTCIDACVTDRDCPVGLTCQAGSCM